MYKILPIVNLIFFLDNFRFATISVIVIVLIVINNKMLYFALRAFGFLITKHKHKNNNVLFSLHSSRSLFILSSYSFIHLLPSCPYFSPFLHLSLYICRMCSILLTTSRNNPHILASLLFFHSCILHRSSSHMSLVCFTLSSL
jgi:hypothetical protein